MLVPQNGIRNKDAGSHLQSISEKLKSLPNRETKKIAKGKRGKGAKKKDTGKGKPPSKEAKKKDTKKGKPPSKEATKKDTTKGKPPSKEANKRPASASKAHAVPPAKKARTKDSLAYDGSCTGPRHYGSVTIYFDRVNVLWRVKPGPARRDLVKFPIAKEGKEETWQRVVKHVKSLAQQY